MQNVVQLQLLKFTIRLIFYDAGFGLTLVYSSLFFYSRSSLIFLYFVLYFRNYSEPGYHPGFSIALSQAHEKFGLTKGRQKWMFESSTIKATQGINGLSALIQDRREVFGSHLELGLVTLIKLFLLWTWSPQPPMALNPALNLLRSDLAGRNKVSACCWKTGSCIPNPTVSQPLCLLHFKHIYRDNLHWFPLRHIFNWYYYICFAYAHMSLPIRKIDMIYTLLRCYPNFLLFKILPHTKLSFITSWCLLGLDRYSQFHQLPSLG